MANTITPAGVVDGIWPVGALTVTRTSDWPLVLDMSSWAITRPSDWPFTLTMSTWEVPRSLELLPVSYGDGVTTTTLPRAMNVPGIGAGSSGRTTGQIWPI